MTKEVIFTCTAIHQQHKGLKKTVIISINAKTYNRDILKGGGGYGCTFETLNETRLA